MSFSDVSSRCRVRLSEAQDQVLRLVRPHRQRSASRRRSWDSIAVPAPRGLDAAGLRSRPAARRDIPAGLSTTVSERPAASRREAAAAVGVRCAHRPGLGPGHPQDQGRRLYPDGRRVDYTRGTDHAAAGAAGAGAGAPPPVPDLAEREPIADLRAAGASMRAVAAALGRPPSTISRELARNTDPDDPDRRLPALRGASGRGRRAGPDPSRPSWPATPSCADFVQDKAGAALVTGADLPRSGRRLPRRRRCG